MPRPPICADAAITIQPLSKTALHRQGEVLGVMDSESILRTAEEYINAAMNGLASALAETNRAATEPSCIWLLQLGWQNTRSQV